MSLSQLINELNKDPGTRLPLAVRNNLLALSEIRDNAVHFVNPSPGLAKRVLEIGTASVKNYIELASRWFHRDLSRYKLYLMPIGFVGAPGTATALAVSAQEANLLEYLESLTVEGAADAAKGFHVALDVHVTVRRSSDGIAAGEYRLTADRSAPVIRMAEEDVLRAFPWDYAELTRRLKARYTDFLQNRKYHAIRIPLKSDERYVRTRFLDPGNRKSPKKEFYNPNIVNEFDEHYTRR